MAATERGGVLDRDSSVGRCVGSHVVVGGVFSMCQQGGPVD